MEHASVAIETAVRNQDMAEAKEIAEGLDLSIYQLLVEPADKGAVMRVK